jgi:dipeptidase E
VTGIHTFDHPVKVINNAKANNQAIVVGGGNTFHLMHTIYQQNLLEPLQHAIAEGTPYIGWSAGSNICGQSIRTTNDMPIVEPESFNALNVVPFQLNPHYSDYHPPGHNGETRDQRLAEFTVLNPTTPVVAIREGTALSLSKQQLALVGEKGGFIFLGDEKRPIAPNENLTELLNSSL